MYTSCQFFGGFDLMPCTSDRNSPIQFTHHEHPLNGETTVALKTTGNWRSGQSEECQRAWSFLNYMALISQNVVVLILFQNYFKLIRSRSCSSILYFWSVGILVYNFSRVKDTRSGRYNIKEKGSVGR